jgi:hypothetical protein
VTPEHSPDDFFAEALAGEAACRTHRADQALTVAQGDAGARHLVEPGHGLVQRHDVHTFRNRRGDAIEHKALQLFPLGDLFNRN